MSSHEKSTIPSPQDIAGEICRRVIGQDEAIEEMSIALSKKLAGLPVGNILVIGSSGTGKTTLMRAVEWYLSEHPQLALRSTVVRMHANVLGEEAERGHSGQVVLHRLLERAREQLGPETPFETLLEQASAGIVFVDEVDKIRAHVGDQPNTSGIRAQEALLTLIENESVLIELPRWAGGGPRTVDSSGLLFVCGGAFEGLYDAVFDRITVGKDRGALKPITTVEEDGQVTERLHFVLSEWLRNVDLYDYGMSPQFLSRFDAVVLLEDLGIEELVRIFLETPESGYTQAQKYFTSRGYRLALSPSAVRRVALEASKEKRMGARALREVFRRVIRPYEYDPGKFANENRGIVLDEKEIVASLRG